MSIDTKPRRATIAATTASACLALAAIAWQCSTPETVGSPDGARASVAETAGIEAWDVVYAVLQHPRCLNCHPAGDAPLQGDDSHVHGQNVQRGADGLGLFAMKCATCHASTNAPGAHLPPGAPGWHLPKKSTPLVFEGVGKTELCRQMRDRARNGDKTPEQLFEHMAHDALVAWGWDPGVGRTPVPVPRDVFAAAARAWVDSGCACPE